MSHVSQQLSLRACFLKANNTAGDSRRRESDCNATSSGRLNCCGGDDGSALTAARSGAGRAGHGRHSSSSRGAPLSQLTLTMCLALSNGSRASEATDQGRPQEEATAPDFPPASSTQELPPSRAASCCLQTPPATPACPRLATQQTDCLSEAGSAAPNIRGKPVITSGLAGTGEGSSPAVRAAAAEWGTHLPPMADLSSEQQGIYHTCTSDSRGGDNPHVLPRQPSRKRPWPSGATAAPGCQNSSRESIGQASSSAVSSHPHFSFLKSSSASTQQLSSRAPARRTHCSAAPILKATTQLHLDLGQTNFAFTTCRVCGLSYARGQPSDEKVHAEFHKRSLEGIKLKDVRKGRVLFHDQGAGRVLMVLPGDPTTLRKQVAEVCVHVEQELGISPGWIQAAVSKAFLYVNSKHRVLGLVLVETIRSAKRAASAAELEQSRGKNEIKKRDDEEGHRTESYGGSGGEARRPAQSSAKAGSCSRVLVAQPGPSVPAVCGVRAMWVTADARRQKVASKLLDSARCQCMVGYVVPRQEVAFCHPTDAGRAFAACYTGTASFLIYG